MGKAASSTNGPETIHMQNKIYVYFDYYCKPYSMINLKWTIDLNLIKLIEENKREKHWSFGLDKDLLGKTQKVQSIKNNIKKTHKKYNPKKLLSKRHH